MNEKACDKLLADIRDAWGRAGTGSAPGLPELNTIFRESSEMIHSLMKEVKTLRETLGDQVRGLVKAAISTETAYDQPSLAYELSIFAESTWACLLDNDWYEGDPNGEDSKAYFETEKDLLKIIKLVEELQNGQPISITTMAYHQTVTLHGWKELTKEVVIASRECHDWLNLNYAPENQEK